MDPPFNTLNYLLYSFYFTHRFLVNVTLDEVVIFFFFLQEPLMDPPLVWFLVNITLAGVVFAVFNFFQRRRFLRDKQTLAAQVHCLE